MAVTPPPATARARVAPGTRPAPDARRPALRLLVPRRAPRHSGRHNRSLWLAAVLVVGSLLTVVVGDDLLAQSQLRLAAVQQQVSAATTTEHHLQVSVALLGAPEVVISTAEHRLHLAPASQVVDVPEVPLDRPLPVPQTAPLAGSGAPTPAPSTSVPMVNGHPAYA